jgi:hypothetical protein
MRSKELREDKENGKEAQDEEKISYKAFMRQ